MTWAALRKEVYRRDEGRCQVCLFRVGKLWDAGHLVDRCVGGADTPENCVLMCSRCNRSIKPIHRTLEEAQAWIREQQTVAHTGREVPPETLAFMELVFH
jgi:5-methylcytosine-specific restriction endonuclease McrA